jgi:hypothetical protein
LSKKNANIFAKIFGENIFKIITSIPVSFPMLSKRVSSVFHLIAHFHFCQTGQNRLTQPKWPNWSNLTKQLSEYKLALARRALQV